RRQLLLLDVVVHPRRCPLEFDFAASNLEQRRKQLSTIPAEKPSLLGKHAQVSLREIHRYDFDGAVARSGGLQRLLGCERSSLLHVPRHALHLARRPCQLSFLITPKWSGDGCYMLHLYLITDMLDSVKDVFVSLQGWQDFLLQGRPQCACSVFAPLSLL